VSGVLHNVYVCAYSMHCDTVDRMAIESSHTHVWVCGLCTRARLLLHVCMCVCVCVSECTMMYIRIHIYVYIYTHTHIDKSVYILRHYGMRGDRSQLLWHSSALYSPWSHTTQARVVPWPYSVPRTPVHKRARAGEGEEGEEGAGRRGGKNVREWTRERGRERGAGEGKVRGKEEVCKRDGKFHGARELICIWLNDSGME